MRPGDHRVCFVGDSFVHGTGDATGLGWTGRVAAAARAAGYDLTTYNLGIRRDTSTDVAARWHAECDVRFRSECTPYVVFSFGANDMTAVDSTLRVPVRESVENFLTIVRDARARCRTLFVGPLPVGDVAQDIRIASLCSTYQLLAGELGVPYLPLAQDLAGDVTWRRAVAAGDGTHPDGDGYALVADRVNSWPAWWFNTADR